MVRRLLILGLVLGAVLTFLGGRSLRSHSVYAVLSGSMGRATPRGSLLIVKQVDVAQYQVGDIITFPLPGNKTETVTHRVVRVVQTEGGRILETKGDANPNGDGWKIPADLVLGRAVAVVPLLGYVRIALQTKVGYLLFALVALLLIVLPACLDALPGTRSSRATAEGKQL